MSSCQNIKVIYLTTRKHFTSCQSTCDILGTMNKDDDAGGDRAGEARGDDNEEGAIEDIEAVPVPAAKKARPVDQMSIAAADVDQQEAVPMVRILFVVTGKESVPVDRFHPGAGIGKLFYDQFKIDPMCQYDYLEVHKMLQFDPTDRRTDLSSWMGSTWNVRQLKTEGCTPFDFFSLDGDTGNHTVPSTNHVLGVLFKLCTRHRRGSQIVVAFTKDSSLELGIRQNGDRLAQFIGTNFDCIHLSDDASFFGKTAFPRQPGKSFADTYYQFLAYDLGQKWWTSVYPPLKLIHLLNNKAVCDAAISKYKLSQATFFIPLGDSEASSEDSSDEWKLIFNKAVDEIPNHPNGTRLPHHSKKGWLMEHGLVGKPLQGHAGRGLVFLTRTENNDVLAKGIDGTVIDTVAQLLDQTTLGEAHTAVATGSQSGRHRSKQSPMKRLPRIVFRPMKPYTFEPFVGQCRRTDTRVFVRRLKKGQWECKHCIDTQLDSDGNISSVSPHPEDPKLEHFVRKVMVLLEDQTGKDWTAHSPLVFRVDVFKLEWLWIDFAEKRCVNDIRLCPLAATFAGCGESHEAIFHMLNDTLCQFLSRNVLSTNF